MQAVSERPKDTAGRQDGVVVGGAYFRILLHFFISFFVFLSYLFVYQLLIFSIFPIRSDILFNAFNFMTFILPIIIIFFLCYLNNFFGLKKYFLIFTIIISVIFSKNAINMIYKIYPDWNNYAWLFFYENSLVPICNFNIISKNRCVYVNQNFNQLDNLGVCNQISINVCDLYKSWRVINEFKAVDIFILKNNFDNDQDFKALEIYIINKMKINNVRLCQGTSSVRDAGLFGLNNRIFIMRLCIG